MIAWLHDFNPVVLKFTEALAVRWYGLAYIAGFVTAWLVLTRLARRRLIMLTPERVGDAIMAVVVGVIVGGPPGYAVFYKPELLWTFTSSPPWWDLLSINKGGMASHGGMIGVIIACWVVSRGRRLEDGTREGAVPVLHVWDVMALASPFGLFFGRLANFINGELLGKIVALPGKPAPWWAVKYPQELLGSEDPARLMPPADAAAREAALTALIDKVRLPNDSADRGLHRLIDAVQHGNKELARQLEPLVSARHPSQLYQAAAEGLVLALVVWSVWYFKRATLGLTGAAWLVTYGVLRIATEFWRLPDAHLKVQRIAGLSRGQWLSVLMIAAGLVLAFFAAKRKTPAPEGTGV